MKSIGTNDFDAATKDSSLALVDFHAQWCGPCKAMEPSLAAIDGKPADVFKVDVDQEPDLAVRFGVRGMPTLVLLKKGEVVDMRVGAQSAGQLSSWIASHA